jgi:hypothetical protein
LLAPFVYPEHGPNVVTREDERAWAKTSGGGAFLANTPDHPVKITLPLGG